MSKALSVDLRIRVLNAVADGASHRQAAARFGVSAASVSRWRALERNQGHPRPGPLGGDRRSGRVEAQGALSGPPLAASPTPSPPPSAPTTSAPADTIQTGRIPL